MVLTLKDIEQKLLISIITIVLNIGFGMFLLSNQIFTFFIPLIAGIVIAGYLGWLLVQHEEAKEDLDGTKTDQTYQLLRKCEDLEKRLEEQTREN